MISDIGAITFSIKRRKEDKKHTFGLNTFLFVIFKCFNDKMCFNKKHDIELTGAKRELFFSVQIYNKWYSPNSSEILIFVTSTGYLLYGQRYDSLLKNLSSSSSAY
jgi:hypothetical protein